jgi:hypothetical protein
MTQGHAASHDRWVPSSCHVSCVSGYRSRLEWLRMEHEQKPGYTWRMEIPNKQAFLDYFIEIHFPSMDKRGLLNRHEANPAPGEF